MSDRRMEADKALRKGSTVENELALIRHFAESINTDNYLDQRLFLLCHLDRLAYLIGERDANQMERLTATEHCLREMGAELAEAQAEVSRINSERQPRAADAVTKRRA